MVFLEHLRGGTPRGTTTVSPILCLMNWNDEQCRQQLKSYIPKFASNFDAPRHVPQPPSSPSYDYEGDEDEEKKEEKDHGIADRSMNDVSGETTGFFSPVLPTVANFPTTRQTEHIDNEVTALITSSLAPQKTRPKSTPHFTVYPVRPTTPMGDTITTTMQAATVTDFPRTPLIMCSSLAVIIAIAAVVFFVFKCRQNPPNSEHYTMAMKSQSGYTAIAPELSPPMNHDRSNDSCTQPLLAKPHINGNGYEPLKGAVIANGNGATATMMRNGNGNGVAKKKDFKEWYV
ncbi:Neurexin-3-beta [Caenorhabditis elegans]|uniref:NRX-1 beta isoform n=1 Tax=Caenorhabditis elegans TaxID=6239 RepID=S6EZT1_CAEEL|eukprot:NP_001294674.1 NeuReXin related [Caenorhabditis elegans]